MQKLLLLLTKKIIKSSFCHYNNNSVLEYHLCCSGWSYEGWKSPFYPDNLYNRYWLSYYSQIFDFVEIDSTFYRMSSKFMVNNWFKITPDNFRFAVKFPKFVTHEKRLQDVGKEIEQYMIRYLFFSFSYLRLFRLQKVWI